MMYVVFAGNDLVEIQLVKQQLHTAFTIKDLGELRCFLSLELARSKSSIFLSQRKFAMELLDDTGYLAFELVNCLMDPHLKLSKDRAAYHVLHYLKSSPGVGIFFFADFDLKLHSFSDSNWAGCVDTCRAGPVGHRAYGPAVRPAFL
ncbi:hypothetical protein K1719_036787 [Acacia pycnantha]|nr:hypothetical protein K1719_036787 [Acacia pycnantha]